MNASVFLLSLAVFFISILFHLIIWRSLKPKKEMLWLFIIYLLFPVGLVWLGSHFFSGFFLLHRLASLLLAWSLSVVVIQTFPGIPAQSPSLVMLLEIHRKRETGISKESLITETQKISFLNDRIKDLENDGLAIPDADGSVRLRFFGLKLAQFFYWYRKILGLPRGAG